MCEAHTYDSNGKTMPGVLVKAQKDFNITGEHQGLNLNTNQALCLVNYTVAIVPLIHGTCFSSRVMFTLSPFIFVWGCGEWRKTQEG